MPGLAASFSHTLFLPQALTRNHQVLLNMGRAVEDMGGGDALREAVMCYSEAVMISPTRADALFAEAYALQRVSHWLEINGV
jgi:hypothetical protein